MVENTREEKKRVVVESLGWLTESSIMPKKHRAISGVGPTSILELKAELYKSQGEAKLSNVHEPSFHRAKAKVTHVDLLSRKNSGVKARDHKDKVELKSISDGSISYAALEKKAELYEKLTKGEVPDDEDNETYCVDFFRKSLMVDESHQSVDVGTASIIPPERHDEDDNEFSLFNSKPLRTTESNRDEHKRLVMEVHEEARKAREKVSELKLIRQEHTAARREKFRQAYLRKKLEKLPPTSKPDPC